MNGQIPHRNKNLRLEEFFIVEKTQMVPKSTRKASCENFHKTQNSVAPLSVRPTYSARRRFSEIRGRS
jgi:hypothetical protein